MKPLASFTLVLFLVMTLGACSLLQGKDARVTSGQLLETVGQEFLSTHTQFKALCAAQAVPLSDCQNFDAFRVRFQKAYPVLVASWQKAVQTGAPTGPITADLLKLKDELVIYALIAQAKRSK